MLIYLIFPALLFFLPILIGGIAYFFKGRILSAWSNTNERWITFLTWVLSIFFVVAIPYGSHDDKWFSIFHKPDFEKQFIKCLTDDHRKNTIEHLTSEQKKTYDFYSNRIAELKIENRKSKAEKLADNRRFIIENSDYYRKNKKSVDDNMNLELDRIDRLEKMQIEGWSNARENEFKQTSAEINRLRAQSKHDHCVEYVYRDPFGLGIQYDPESIGIPAYYSGYLFKSTFRKFFFGETKEFWLKQILEISKQTTNQKK
jgi:hypothetical protein